MIVPVVIGGVLGVIGGVAGVVHERIKEDPDGWNDFKRECLEAWNDCKSNIANDFQEIFGSGEKESAHSENKN